MGALISPLLLFLFFLELKLTDEKQNMCKIIYSFFCALETYN